jgi:UDP-N-acetyl-D-mannosaminuronic acid dehydrogenase
LPGRIVNELVHNDRVIGGVTPACAERAAVLYTSFVKGDCLYTTARVAETVKLVENSFRDVNIAFANELSMIADVIGVDVWDVIRLANRHPRVNILQPGPGVGGHCIAVDPWFLVAGAPEAARLVRTAREVNDHKAVHTENRIRALLDAAPMARSRCWASRSSPTSTTSAKAPRSKSRKAFPTRTASGYWWSNPSPKTCPAPSMAAARSW